jgi:hypothetical protein
MSMLFVRFETYSIFETTKMEFVILVVKMDHFLIVATEASPSSSDPHQYQYQYDADTLSGQEYSYY